MCNQAPQNNELRRVMDACLPGLENKPNFERDVLRQVRGEVKVKKKLSVGLLLALVLTIASISIAAALSFNLFEWFGQKEQRFAEIAPKSIIEPMLPISIQNGKLGETAVFVTNAYYDGESLLIGYTTENTELVDLFTPSAEQLSQMQSIDTQTSFDYLADIENEFATQYQKAIQEGSPFGAVKSTVLLSDYAYSDDGTDLGTWTEINGVSGQDTYNYIRDFDNLPVKERNRESLTLHIPIHQSTSYLYYDGQTAFVMVEQNECKPLTVTIPKANKVAYQFEGSSSIDGTRIDFTVDATVIHLSATVTATEGQLPILSDDLWYDMCLRDETGSFFEASGFEQQDEHTLVFTFNGSGTLPEHLSASLLIIGDHAGTKSISTALTKAN